jgi:hypothetical protein
MAYVNRNGAYGFIDRNGAEATSFGLEQARPFKDGVAPVRLQGRWAFIDRSGKTVIPPEFRNVGPFGDGRAPVNGGTDWFYINAQGRDAGLGTFADARPFVDGIALVRPKGADAKYRFIRPDGALALPGAFEAADSFREGLAPVRIVGEWGYVDNRGKIVIEPVFGEARRFQNGLAEVVDPVFRRSLYIKPDRRVAFARSDRTLSLGAASPVPLHLSSDPSGAAVYVIPLLTRQRNPDLESRPDPLYAVPEGRTGVETAVEEKVYIVLFELGTVRRFVRVDVRPNNTNKAHMDFK